MIFEVRLKASTYSVENRGYTFTFDGKPRTISTLIFRWDDENITSAYSKINPDEVDYLDTVPGTITLGERIY